MQYLTKTMKTSKLRFPGQNKILYFFKRNNTVIAFISTISNIVKTISNIFSMINSKVNNERLKTESHTITTNDRQPQHLPDNQTCLNDKKIPTRRIGTGASPGSGTRGRSLQNGARPPAGPIYLSPRSAPTTPRSQVNY